MQAPAATLATSMYRFRHAIVLGLYFVAGLYALMKRRAARLKRRQERLEEESRED